MMTEVSCCKNHIRGHLYSIHVPVRVADFANRNHKRLDHKIGSDVVVDRKYSRVIQSFHLIHWIRQAIQIVLNLNIVSWQVIRALQQFQMFLYKHSKNLLHDPYLAPSMMAALNPLSDLQKINCPISFFQMFYK